eukprot:TRINITY_DN2488_c0_g1_i1.p1 TRINITY_DN2488_c0_g1~~TRINITY_DN2488_c0_g1_i1.p1  ORF type:complete len:297 (-),score=63.63 TRINITY_DN2488_c0_g1_i1:171-1061(-)
MEKVKKESINYILGGLAGMGAVTVSNPFEVCKVRMQLQGELVKKGERPFRNVFHAFFKIITTEGLRGIQKGLSVSYVHTFIMNGTRLGSYSVLKSLMDTGGDESGTKKFLKSLLAGSLAGSLAAVITNPAFLIKTRFQSNKQEYQYKGMIDAVRKIYKSDGMHGFYRGWQAMAVRMGIGSGTQLSSYDWCKKVVISTGIVEENSPLTFFVSSLFSSFIVVIAMNPPDLILTRLYSQTVRPDGQGALYSGFFDAGVKVFKAEGPLAFYKGLTSHYARVGPHTICTLVFFEWLKQLFE